MNKEQTQEFLKNLEGTIDNIEIHPLIGLDENMNICSYKEAVNFEEALDEEDDDIIAWGVYVHKPGEGISCLFDVMDKENAIQAELVLRKLLNLEVDV